jgi:hypothetical protein
MTTPSLIISSPSADRTRAFGEDGWHAMARVPEHCIHAFLRLLFLLSAAPCA